MTAPKERPILFSGPMVTAILSGQKTQTRRVIKGQALEWLAPDMFTPEFVADPENGLCPYGQPGDRLWVREAWAVPHMYDGHKPGGVPDTARVHYADAGTRGGLLWRSPIFMPRWASRLTLEVVSVRVERLQDITEEDVYAEGAVTVENARREGTSVPLRLFAWLWDSINGKRPGCSWDDNPWVWVVEFKAVTP